MKQQYHWSLEVNLNRLNRIKILVNSITLLVQTACIFLVDRQVLDYTQISQTHHSLPVDTLLHRRWVWTSAGVVC